MKSNKIHFLLSQICIGSGISLFLGCQTATNSDQQKDSLSSFEDTAVFPTEFVRDSLVNDTFTQITYLFPSPDEILNETLSSKLEYNAQLVNPEGNIQKYINAKQQALNLGIYMSDLAYINLNGDKNLSLTYLKTVRDLAEKINIYHIIDDNLYNQLQENIANKDSLTEIFHIMYNDIRDKLETSQRNNVYALIASGVLVEALYISTMSVKSFSEYKPIASKIFEQKYLIKNYYEFASQYRNDPGIKEVLTLLQNFSSILNQANIKSKKVEVTKQSKEHFTISGGEVVNVNEDDFNRFRENVIKIRQEIVSGKL